MNMVNTGLAQSLFGDDHQVNEEPIMSSLLVNEPNVEQDFSAIYQQNRASTVSEPI